MDRKAELPVNHQETALREANCEVNQGWSQDREHDLPPGRV